jgi:hypothetical protein
MTLPLLPLRCVRRLGAALLGSAALAATAACPELLIERFIPADCEACWRSASPAASGSLALDWIVPVAQGDEAALAAAAMPEAARRASGLKPGATLERTHVLQGLHVEIEDGPAWSGYMGVVLRVQRDDQPLPAGAAGYLALVETVRPGEEGTPIERHVLRVLAGPLTIDAALPRVEHLLALRLPQGARGDRLGAFGWVEDGSGRVLAAAQADGVACTR